MANEVYVVTGATGNIGFKIVERLVAAKQKVRAIARKVDKLRPLSSKGVEAFPATLDDTGSITRAFTGAKAVFTMIPPNATAPAFRAYQNRLSQVYSASIVGAGVRTIVNLSSIGANQGTKMGPVNGLFDHEQRLNKLEGVNLLHLRPAYFMENHINGVEGIKKMGVYGTPIKEDVTFPMIATSDIAAEAAERLLKMDFTGKQVKELLGPKDYSMREVTRIIAEVMAKPELKYQQFSYEDTQKALVGMGMSADFVSQLMEMMKSMNDKSMKSTESRSAKNTTPTTFEEFAKAVFPTLTKKGK
jgi:uncharacterized protein YbjT (DUF2867 family)